MGVFDFPSYCFIMFFADFVYCQWSEIEALQILEATNRRHSEIERMTKEAAMRHNQGNGESLLHPSPPIPPPPIKSELVPIGPVAPKQPIPTIEDDRTFLAKMNEQETLVNHLNSLAAREAATQTGFFAMEQSLLNALRPIAVPLMSGQPIVGHFMPLQRVPRPIEESPRDRNIEIQSRPIETQLPLRSSSWDQKSFEELRNETYSGNY